MELEQIPKSFFDISEKDWNFVIDSQLKSTFLSCQILVNK